MLKHNILIVDDDEDNLIDIRSLIQRWGYNIDTVTSGEEAIDCIRAASKEYSVAVIDFRMPGKNGPQTADEIRKLNGEIITIIYTAYEGSKDDAVATIRAGALNYIERTENNDVLKESLGKACELYEKVRKVKPTLSVDEATKIITGQNLAGRSRALAEGISNALDYRQSKKTVLLLGETGVGKEIFARMIHNGPAEKFFTFSCTVSDEGNLFESELFGHEKGAFTGAIARKVGIFEAARGGTVFLDEIHHMAPQAQAKLLRVIREKKVRRVGAQQEVDVDFRLIVASHPDLEARVANKSFLPDLYYRIKFLCIEIPPLRERTEDIEPIVLHLCDKHFKETGERKEFRKAAMRQLEKYPWPGNVGELDGYVSALLTNTRSDTIEFHHLDKKMQSLDGKANPVLDASHKRFKTQQQNAEREFIRYQISLGPTLRQTAARMGISPSTLHTLIDRHGLRSELNDHDVSLDDVGVGVGRHGNESLPSA